MGLDDRVFYFLVGCALGSLFGYMVRYLTETKKELREVHKIVADESPRRDKDEKGLFKMDRKTVQSFALFIVVLLTVFASVQSQIASNKADDSQDQLSRVVTCVINNQTEFLNAVNTRVAFTQRQATANKDLQEAQQLFFAILLHIPPYGQEKKNEAAHKYQTALNTFVSAAKAYEKNTKVSKYPTAKELLTCVREKRKG